MKHTDSAASVLWSATSGAVSKLAIPIGTSESVYQQKGKKTHAHTDI